MPATMGKNIAPKGVICMAVIMILTALAVSLAAGWLLLRFEHLHAWASHDLTSSGPQKFHVLPTPRIGGVQIAAGLLAGLAVNTFNTPESFNDTALFCVAVAPAFFSGLIEDLTKKIGPDIRLWASFLSALLCVYFFDVAIHQVGISWLDQLLSWYPIALVFTVVAIGGVAHAVNIIDGYNGLAAMVSILILSSIGLVSWWVGDPLLLTISSVLAASSFGFLCLNWPKGRMFAGDGGAYLWGVGMGALVVMLVSRNSAVSPWFALMLVGYPATETLFTIYRRKFLHRTASGQPDAMHLHQLIYRRLLSMPKEQLTDAARVQLNSTTSVFLWILTLISLVPALLFWRDTTWLIFFSVLFVLIYLWCYRAIVRFAVPLWLRRLARSVVNRIPLR